VDVTCPFCGKEMLLRKGRFGPFVSCTGYPECKGIVKLDKKGFLKHPTAPPLEVDVPCPKCESAMFLRRSKRGPWLSCSKFPKCRGRVGWTTLDDDRQKQLETQLLQHERDNPVPLLRHLDGTPIDKEELPREVQPTGGQSGE